MQLHQDSNPARDRLALSAVFSHYISLVHPHTLYYSRIIVSSVHRIIQSCYFPYIFCNGRRTHPRWQIAGLCPNTGKKITSDTSSHRRLNVWVRRFELPASWTPFRLPQVYIMHLRQYFLISMLYIALLVHIHTYTHSSWLHFDYKARILSAKALLAYMLKAVLPDQ